MRIDAWRIEAFGPLVDWEETGLARHDLVIVVGANESGKSALSEFLTSMIFGFSPATATDHPYRPWDGRTGPDGKMTLILRAATRMQVARRLRSRPEGRLTVNGLDQNLSNHPVQGVPRLLNRSIFTNVHALTQDKALTMDPGAWQAVKDRVLGGTSFDFLRPTREVVSELEGQRTSYWRPDRRGKPRARKMHAQIKQLKASLGPARARRSEVENIKSRLQELRQAEQGQDGQLRRIKVALERDAKLAPLLSRVQRMEKLEREAKEVASQLPADARQQRQKLTERGSDLCKLIDGLSQQIHTREEKLLLDSGAIAILAKQDVIGRLAHKAAGIPDQQDRISRMTRRLQELDGQHRELGRRIFVGERLDGRTKEAVLDISIPDLRGRHRTWQEQYADHQTALKAASRAEGERRSLKRDLEDGESKPDRRALDQRLRQVRAVQLDRAKNPRPTPLPRWVLMSAVAVGMAAVVLGTLLGGSPGIALAVGGTALAGPAGVFLILLVTSRPTLRLPIQNETQRAVVPTALPPDLPYSANLEDEIQRTEMARDEAIRREAILAQYARAQIAATEAKDLVESACAEAVSAREGFLNLLANLPLAQVFHDSPDQGLEQDLQELRRTIEEEMRLRRNLEERFDTVRNWQSEVRHMREAVADDLPADPSDAVADAQRRLDAARELKKAAEMAATEIPGLKEKLIAAQTDADATESCLAQLNAGLGALDRKHTDPARGLELLETAHKGLAEAVLIRNELDHDAAGWEERADEARTLITAGTNIKLGDEEKVALEQDIQTLDKDRQDSAEERGRLEKTRDGLMAEPGPAHLAGEIASAEEALEDVHHEHNRLAMLQNLIRVAEYEYRRRFQAPLLSLAGEYLQRFTGGRYVRLTVEDAEGSKVELEVWRRGEDFPRPVASPPLSRGTIQQVYFALRLAMVDQVESDEPLPLFLDEMFVNWDPSRTTGGIEVLADMPRGRQVFLFTSDPFWAERAQKHVKARILHTPELAMLDD